jgi:S1-C subfamily serine protease
MGVKRMEKSKVDCRFDAGAREWTTIPLAEAHWLGLSGMVRRVEVMKLSAKDYARRYSSSILWVALALGALLIWQFWVRGAFSNSPAAPRPVAPRGDLDPEEKATIALFRQASPSVVHITTLAVARDFFTLNLLQIPEGTGSGFIWDDAGHVVTNFHVIQNADAAQVTLADHSNWKARRVGVAPDKDLAVLRIEAPKSKLLSIPIGTSKDLQVGQKAFAIGNPFGLDQSLTRGVISAVGREIESVTRRPIQGVIQTDTAINPGNSGGPLLDSAGRLIGVNTAIYSPSGASAGIGFAIPVDIVNRVVPELIRYGKLTRPGLGVQVAEDQMTRQLGLSGVLVVDVAPGGAAARAGIRPTQRDAAGRVKLGDVVVGIDGKKVESTNDLYLVLEQYKVGDTVTVDLLRDQKRQQVKVTLEALK